MENFCEMYGWTVVQLCETTCVALKVKPSEEEESFKEACALAEVYLESLHPDKQREVIGAWLRQLGELARSQPDDPEDMDLN